MFRRLTAAPRGLLAGLAMAALAGCGLPSESAPTYYYLLDPIEPAAERPAGGGVTLGLEPAGIPAYLDRQSIVTRGENAALEVASFHQWGEPLQSNVTRVLAENLRLLLDSTDVVRLPAQGGTLNAELLVDMVRFEREADGQVTLVARWQVLEGGSGREIASRRTVVQTEAAGPDYPATVQAMNAALEALSRRIADHLREVGAAA
jgi:hypothetical protein